MKNTLLVIAGFILGALATYFFCCPDSAKETIIAPKGIITPDEAKTLDQAFNSRHRLISDSIVKRPDNRSSWYALEDMRNYLNYAENQAKDLGYTMNGIRVYLGAYPDEKDQVGYTTMFFVPTGHKVMAQGSMLLFTMDDDDGGGDGGGDIPGGNGFNGGGDGRPPFANYPQ